MKKVLCSDDSYVCSTAPVEPPEASGSLDLESLSAQRRGAFAAWGTQGFSARVTRGAS